MLQKTFQEADIMMTKQERDLLIEELKICSGEYQYREQLIVTEFGFTMTALPISISILTATDNSNPWINIGIYACISAFLLVASYHTNRLNQDRRAAGRRMHVLKEQLGIHQIHQGYAGKRRGVPAPKVMIYFLCSMATIFGITTLYFFYRELSKALIFC